ncbi:hypothetical protein GCM10007175_21050 [Pseudarthrobacter scleromae]|uniref:Uncharacterized protein n=1 Tax=Pseudarthrobacter scleromae TaxID=158897 RepID=A0ABQ2CH99_9MICC|nr:hypothetical protein GCM10007175_21050 [Pseudarthrobacter scleromae]
MERATQQPGAFPHSDQAVARRAAAGRAGGTIIIDRQPHVLGVTHDSDGYPRRVAGVPSRIRDRLLGQAVERGPDHGAEIVELTGQLHVDPRPSLGLTGKPSEVSNARARREVHPGDGLGLANQILSMLMMVAVGWGCDCEGNREGCAQRTGRTFFVPGGLSADFWSLRGQFRP